MITIATEVGKYYFTDFISLGSNESAVIDEKLLVLGQLKSLRNAYKTDRLIVSSADRLKVEAEIESKSQTGGGGNVNSVQGEIGDVVLDADDVGATTQTYVDTQDNLIINSLTLKADTNYVDTQDSLLQDQIDLKADAIAVSQSLDTKADAMATSQSLALKADLIGGLIPASQLPSYVDDVLNFPDLASFPFVGEDGKIYIAEDVNKTYRWGGSSYVESGGGGVALGETSSTAYRGDNGKIAYDHSQSQGNPHNTTTSDINEGTKLFFTESRVNQTVLTGLNTSTASPALATDQLLAAIGKLQAQINNVNPSAAMMPVNAQTGTTYTLTLADAGSCVEMNNAAANTLTIPPNSTVAYGVGTTILIRQMGAGQTTLVADSGVTVRNPHGTLKLFKQYTSVALHKRATDEWCIEGNLAES